MKYMVNLLSKLASKLLIKIIACKYIYVSLIQPRSVGLLMKFLQTFWRRGIVILYSKTLYYADI